MKRYALLSLCVALIMLLVPSVICASEKSREDNENATGTGIAVNGAAKTENRQRESEKDGEETIAVFLPQEDKAVEMSMRSYIISCVAAEMPAAYSPDALCAQALASVTLARYMQQRSENGKEKREGEITADSKKHQGYMSVEEMKRRWGEDFDMYYEKLCSAVDTVLGYTLTYEGKPALTAFHAMSAGMTEDAANVWGKSIPYLISVDSPGDKSARDYLTVSSFGREEIIKKLSLDELPENEALWVSKESYSKAGRLKSIEIGGKEFSGDTLRGLLNLRSPAIGVKVEKGNFIFETRGYGHGVGLSQTGAEYMAKQGSTWQEIAAHYYPGTHLTPMA